ncbi:hypothetical protein ACFQFH_08945 [Halobaculum halobium]|uniref:hypothetical protein n=1 Tax=Halobaculum halobium TaxID=3032281 RepID=UPI003614FAE2
MDDEQFEGAVAVEVRDGGAGPEAARLRGGSGVDGGPPPAPGSFRNRRFVAPSALQNSSSRPSLSKSAATSVRVRVGEANAGGAASVNALRVGPPSACAFASPARTPTSRG